MFENLISALKAEKRTIVFTEGEDARILEAASRLKKDGLMDSILVGNVEAAKAALHTAIVEISKAGSKGVYHKKTVSRKIARLSKAVDSIA